MCVQAIPALLSAGGAVIQQVGANQQRRDQDRILQDSQRRAQLLNNRAGERVAQEIQTVAGANPEDERRAAQNDFMEALRKAKVADGGADISGPAGASDRFTADVGQARNAASAEGRGLAGNLAAIDAPNYSRIKESRGLADTATDLSLLQGEGRGLDFLTQLRMARTNGGSPLTGVGEGLTAFGEAYGQRAVKPKKPTLATFQHEASHG